MKVRAVTRIQSIGIILAIIAAAAIGGAAWYLSKPAPTPTPTATPELTYPQTQTYIVHKLQGELTIDADWNKEVWQGVEPLQLNYYMGEKPAHFPKTEVKLLYDDENIYVIFRVEDQYVRAVAQNYHGRVWEDSCVEFFFTPGSDIKEGYFNLEMNCGGTFLFCHQTARGENVKYVEISDCQQVEVAHSLPKIVYPEIKEPVTWVVEYRIPIYILEKYANVTRPALGAVWRANFYKCGDKTSHPHWLTWSPVDNPTPDFHLPEYFGVLSFTD